MKALVTGATGYLGRALCALLGSEGITVHAFCRSRIKSQAIAGDHVKIFLGELHDKTMLGKALDGCEQVYHLAAFTKIWSKDQSIYHKINVDFTKTLLELAIPAGVQKMVMTSSGGVLGPSPDKQTPVTENSKRYAVPESAYEQSKILAEQEVFKSLEQGLNVVVVNPTRVYGPGPKGQSNSVTRMIKLFLDGKWRVIPGDGESIGNYVYIDDVVRGHLLAMNKGRSGERYILGGTNISYNHLFQLLQELTNKHHRIIHVPLNLLLLFAHLQKFLANTFDIQPMLVPELVKKLYKHWNMSSAKAIKDLGYETIPIKEGLKRTLDWIEKG
jgi:nucleoside-diphosphate-sugar epimerase